MTVIANPCKDVHGSNRNSLIGLALNDTQTQMLLSIIRRVGDQNRKVHASDYQFGAWD